MTASADVMLLFDCACGSVLARSLAVIDDEHIVRDESKLSARCPSCQMYRRADDWAEIDHPEDACWYRLSLEEGDMPPVDGANPFLDLVDEQSSAQSVAAPRSSPTEPCLPPDCEGCGQELSDDDHRTGPDAPEIGWTYYECPSCEALSRPAH